MRIQKSHLKWSIGVLVLFMSLAIPLVHFSLQSQKLVETLYRNTPSDVYWERLAFTTYYLQNVKTGKVDELKKRLTNELDRQLYDLIEITNNNGSEYSCYFQKLFSFRKQLDSEHLDIKVTKLLQERLERNACNHTLRLITSSIQLNTN